jgi:hypothetical protein
VVKGEDKMTRFGTNMKMIISSDYETRVRKLFVDVLGAAAMRPRPDLEVYRLADGANVGVQFVPPPEAIPEAEQRKSTWLEFVVSDPAAIAGELEALGLARVEYYDNAHSYYQVPGGPVFRIAG